MRRIAVWAEHFEGFVHVGFLQLDTDGAESFSYTEDYLGRADATPIYPSLPLSEKPFDTSATRAAFFSLGPEGRVGHEIRNILRADRDSVEPILERLNHETIGALTFTDENERLSETEYAVGSVVDAQFLEVFAADPDRIALSTMLENHLSLNGAVAKIGVVQQGDTWYLPQGLTPTTHIFKVGSHRYPHQMLNEALCMRSACLCGFDDAAETSLISVDQHEPILVSKRFDRIETEGRPYGLSPIMRLQQADFCQIMGISVDMLKYVPADDLIEPYITSMASAVLKESNERFGDRMYLFDCLVFDYLIGNCDNHLKNFSMTWSKDWTTKTVSPIYDVTCTTIYHELSRNMGLGIGEHRSLDAIDSNDFSLLAQQLDVGRAQAKQSVAELAERLAPALTEAAHSLQTEYGKDIEELAEQIIQDSLPRRELALKTSLRL